MKNDKHTEELLDVLFDIAGAKRVPPEPVKLASQCPYCSSKCESLYALDHHIDSVHNSSVN